MRYVTATSRRNAIPTIVLVIAVSIALRLSIINYLQSILKRYRNLT